MYLMQPLQPSSSAKLDVVSQHPMLLVLTMQSICYEGRSLQRRCRGVRRNAKRCSSYHGFHLETPEILYKVIDRSLGRIHLHELIKSPSSRFLRRRQRPHRICRTPLLARYELQQNQKKDENQKCPGKRSDLPRHARVHPRTLLQPTLTLIGAHITT